MKKYYIGLATTFHEPAVAIVNPEGEVLFAEATERYLQNKSAINCEPDHIFRISELLKEYTEPDAEFVVATTWSDKAAIPFTARVLQFLGLFKPELLLKDKLDRISKILLVKQYQLFHFSLAFVSMSMKAGANLIHAIRQEFGHNRVSFMHLDHHLTHAATACFTSPFENAVCVIVDGFGEKGSMAFFHYEHNELKLIARHKGPESLGALYWWVTHFCGFSVYKGEEWKVMGLAPYGELDQEIYDLFKSMVRVEGYMPRYTSTKQIRICYDRFQRMQKERGPSPMEAANLAYTGQTFFCDIMDQVLKNVYDLGLSEHLVLGGGCALNSSYNGLITTRTPFQKLHVPMAPGDDGNALGAALWAYRKDHPAPPLHTQRPSAVPHSPYLGSRLSSYKMEHLIRFSGIQKLRHLPGTVHQEAAAILAQGKLIGWVQGRAEFGPRALGDRSILADPRPPEMKDKINSLVKFREEFRPFAPSVLHEFGDAYFENYEETPYMERTLRFREEMIAKVPAVVHANRTGRLQSVKREWNSQYYDLIKAFYVLTDVPIVLNTSYNIMGKPIIHSVEDAIGVFFTSGLDALVIEDYLIEK